MKRPGKVISPSPIHFNRYGTFYRALLTQTFKGYETGFMSEMFEIYANSPFLLKFGVLFLIRNDVLDAGRVLELLTKKLFSDDPEHLATIIEIIDELQLGYSLEGKMAELARARKSLPSDLTLDGQKMTLLHKKTREFLFQD